MDLKNKTVLITGATGGIGSSLATKLTSFGAKLILLGRDQNKLSALGTQLNALTYSCDLTDRSSRQEAINTVVKNHPVIDILIHSAGIAIDKHFTEVTLADWDLNIALDAEAPYFLTQGLLPSLNPSGSTILSIGSKMGVVSTAKRSLYCASKAALRSMMLSLAEEYKDSSIRFVLITLGPVMTEFGGRTLADRKREHAAGKAFFSPGEVADKVSAILLDTSAPAEITFYP